ncbi:MAG: hypothetical protein OMM_03895 [Candidatus Magnetoglobus multicellularis str. Araruama]|uniref:CTHRC1 C-terminal domain-containing protein n=1 Tax=Candidatus Magnetoglobus multicellularis str. Araruama TaxID=890399 RepID=A0A1V1P443_9BACT|nr:MAG: hypothetical protein OMM_03895 [Candidatus Magnetoglobus multicellularis str. Araruama]
MTIYKFLIAYCLFPMFILIFANYCEGFDCSELNDSSLYNFSKNKKSTPDEFNKNFKLLECKIQELKIILEKINYKNKDIDNKINQLSLKQFEISNKVNEIPVKSIVEETAKEKLNEYTSKIINTSHISKLGPTDYTNPGLLKDRVLKFDKLKENSIIRIGYTDTFQAHGKNKACRWEIKIDGLSCPSGKLIYGRHDGKESNIHDSNHIIGYCENISKGKHNIQIWVGATIDG